MMLDHTTMVPLLDHSMTEGHTTKIPMTMEIRMTMKDKTDWTTKDWNRTLKDWMSKDQTTTENRMMTKDSMTTDRLDPPMTTTNQRTTNHRTMNHWTTNQAGKSFKVKIFIFQNLLKEIPTISQCSHELGIEEVYFFI